MAPAPTAPTGNFRFWPPRPQSPREKVRDFQHWTDEDKTRTSCLDKLKGIHVMFKIIAVLAPLIIALSPVIPKIVAGIKTTETMTEIEGLPVI